MKKAVIPTNKHMKEILKAVKFFKTQKSMSEALEISPQMVNDWIKGRWVIPLPHAHTLEKLTKGLVTAQSLRYDLKCF